MILKKSKKNLKIKSKTKSKKNLKIKSKTKSKKNLKIKSKKNLRGGALTFGQQPLRTKYAAISSRIKAAHAAHAERAERKQSVQPFQKTTQTYNFPKALKVVKTPYSSKINYSKI
jgi:hypothetical protein